MRRIYIIIILSLLFVISTNGQESIQLLGELNQYSNAGYNDIWGYSADGREYALLCTNTGTSIVDVTDPENPTEVKFIGGPPSGWRDIKTHGSYAFVVTEGESNGSGMQIIDLSELPENASLVDTYDDHFTSAHNIFIEDGYAYVVGTDGGGGIHIIDLSSPEKPSRTAYYTASGYVHDVYAWGDTLIACAEDTYDLVDLSDKKNPQLISSSAALPGIYAHSGWMTEDKRYFYAAEEFNQRDITVWDLQDRENWKLVIDGIKLSDETPVHNIFIIGDYAHISYYKEGYVVFDISNPESPVLVGQYDTYSSNAGFYRGAWGCYPYLPSGNIIISDMVSGLYVFSFTPVENPAPFLTHLPVDEVIVDERSVDLEVSIMDNGSIEEAFAYYRTSFDGETSEWVSLTNSASPNGNKYQFTIPAQNHLTVVEYYFAAKDNGGEVSTLPQGGGGDPAGSVPPDKYYSYQIIKAGVPVILSISPDFSDTTLVKGEKIDFEVSAVDTSDLELSYGWYIRGIRRSNDSLYTYDTELIQGSKTDTLELVVSNGYKEVSKQYIITVDVSSGIGDGLELSYSLNQNYPNPFNPTTKVSYSIPEAANVKLNIYNALGELVTTLVNSYQPSGKYEVNFNAANLSSGFYIAQISTEKFNENIKMLLIK